MIHNLSNDITTFFMKKQLLDDNDNIVFCYGMELLISTVIGVLLILLASSIAGDILWGIVYLIYIVPIRMYVGGYHAKNYWSCNTIFLLFFIIAFTIYKNIGENEYQILSYINLASVLVIFKWAPLENKNKIIKKIKKKKYRNIDMFIYVIGGLLGICLRNMYWINILTIVLINVTILLFMGKGVEIYEKENKK